MPNLSDEAKKTLSTLMSAFVEEVLTVYDLALQDEEITTIHSDNSAMDWALLRCCINVVGSNVTSSLPRSKGNMEILRSKFHVPGGVADPTKPHRKSFSRGLTLVEAGESR